MSQLNTHQNNTEPVYLLTHTKAMPRSTPTSENMNVIGVYHHVDSAIHAMVNHIDFKYVGDNSDGYDTRRLKATRNLIAKIEKISELDPYALTDFHLLCYLFYVEPEKATQSHSFYFTPDAVINVKPPISKCVGILEQLGLDNSNEHETNEMKYVLSDCIEMLSRDISYGDTDDATEFILMQNANIFLSSTKIVDKLLVILKNYGQSFVQTVDLSGHEEFTQMMINGYREYLVENDGAATFMSNKMIISPDKLYRVEFMRRRSTNNDNENSIITVSHVEHSEDHSPDEIWKIVKHICE